MSSPLHAEKLKSLVRFALAIAVVLFGVQAVGTSWALVAFPVVAIGVLDASRAFARLVRIQAVERELFAQARADFVREFHRSTLPRQVYWLLLAIAEADGVAGEKERRLVRDFVLERFAPDAVHDLAEWHRDRAHALQITALAASLRAILTRSETETLFFWACLVAFIDGRFNDLEHGALQQAARGLGLDGVHARRIFWHAKHAFLGANGDGRQRDHRSPSARTTVSARQRALEILGLDENATFEDVRRRHRELAKQFHPDRHAHLGEQAAKEAAARFREVQQAYETLRA